MKPLFSTFAVLLNRFAMEWTVAERVNWYSRGPAQAISFDWLILMLICQTINSSRIQRTRWHDVAAKVGELPGYVALLLAATWRLKFSSSLITGDW